MRWRKMHNFKELNIWQRSRKLVSEVYYLASKIDKSEKFGLISQIRKSAVSVPSNISEGCGRGSDKQLNHFLDIAIGSLCELETQILLVIDLKFVEKEMVNEMLKEIEEIKKMICGFKKNLI